MAPVKPGTHASRSAAATAVLELLTSRPQFNELTADATSEVKGLFTRSCKQDQWDWFTVWTQLDRPGRKRCRDISNELGALRQALCVDDDAGITLARDRLKELGTVTCLRRFLGLEPDPHYVGNTIGYIYILSTRTNPRMLKIGYTRRTVEQRVKEINRATGVVEPYGVRAVWVVDRARHVEAAIHEALASYRIRTDREFFEIPYGTAFKIIGDIVHQSRREI